MIIMILINILLHIVQYFFHHLKLNYINDVARGCHFIWLYVDIKCGNTFVAWVMNPAGKPSQVQALII